MDKGIFWNSEPGRQFLYHWGTKSPTCELFKQHGQWLLEYNPIPDNSAQVMKATYTTRRSEKPKHQKDSIDLWHRRMGHLSKEAIRHLLQAAEGVTITGKDDTTYPAPLCEACKLSEIPRQTSRRPMPRATRPCERVHLDLIPFTEAYNGDEQSIHMFCEASRMNWIDTMPNKGCSLTSVQDFTKLVENVWDCKVRCFHLDGETSLSKGFKELTATKGIAVERSAPHTPEQNGKAERIGGVITRRARAMRLESILPENLWPEMVRAAVHLMNRVPVRELGWKTPLQVMRELTGVMPANRPCQPNLGYIKVYGCRAYAKEHKILKLRKMVARAQIGYLVGYDSSNIFRIWNPRRNKVFSTRDVIFDETRKFDPKHPYLEDELLEAIDEPTVLIEVPSLRQGGN
jgi:GAG-pre-integrase domain